MRYTLTKPCDQCPFLKSMKGFRMSRLREMASGEFPCHRTATIVEDDENGSEYRANKNSLHCAGALIFNEKRGLANQMMRICERLGFYDASKLEQSSFGDVR